MVNPNKREELEANLYGQPFAQRILTKSIGNHWSEENPPLPLVMMLHGPTGVGKNHISRLLARKMELINILKILL